VLGAVAGERMTLSEAISQMSNRLSFVEHVTVAPAHQGGIPERPSDRAQPLVYSAYSEQALVRVDEDTKLGVDRCPKAVNPSCLRPTRSRLLYRRARQV
jgi:hypothetical protein